MLTFTKHIKKPLTELYNETNKIDCKNQNSIKKFLKKFEDNYKEVVALLNGIEDEIIELEREGGNLKKGELSLEDLEKKINMHLKSAKE